MPLNDLQCRHAKPQAKPYKLYDAGGLYLEVMTNGSKYWRYKYRIDGKEKRLAIGIYPNIPLLEARILHEAARQERKKGFDPVFLKGVRKQAATYDRSQTLETIAREWYAANHRKWKPKYAREILQRLENHLFPDLGKYPIRQLTTPDLYVCVKKVADKAPHAAKRLRQRMSEIFCFAVQTGRADRDLTVELKSAVTGNKVNHRASLEIDQMPELLHKLHDPLSGLCRFTILATQIMLLTSVRRSELMLAEWVELDFDKAMWTIPAARMKMAREHLVPLSVQAIAALRELYQLTGNRSYLFPSLCKSGTTMNKALIQNGLIQLGYKGRMTTHGVRALFMGICKERLKYRHEIPDRQLAHVPANEIDRAYDRAKYMAERTEMMQDYADYLEQLTQPSQPTQTKRTINYERTNPITASYSTITTHYRLYTTAGSTGLSWN